MNKPTKLGMRLKAKRVEEGLSLRELARLVGVSFSGLARVERGVGSCTEDTRSRIQTWLDTGARTEPKEKRPRNWMQTIEQRVARIERILEGNEMSGRGDLLDTYYAYIDGLAIAIEALLDFSWEGSSVNFKARTALNGIRDRSSDCARLIEEVRARRLPAQSAGTISGTQQTPGDLDDSAHSARIEF